MTVLGANPRTQALSRALDFLLARQSASGELPVALWSAAEPRAAVPDATIFATALAVPALSAVDDPRAAALARGGARFLAGERLPGGVWRFWPRSHPRHCEIPPDLDDTCCAGAVVSRLGLARAARPEWLLAQRGDDGRFLTWMFPRSWRPLGAFLGLLGERRFRSARHRFWLDTEARRDDVDAGVNANVLLLLGDRPETAAAARWLVDLVARGAEEGSDKWHARSWSVRYLVARAAAAGVGSLTPALTPLADRIAAEAAGIAADGDAVDLALAAATAARCRQSSAPSPSPEAIRVLVDALLERQRADGSWPEGAVWFGGPRRTVAWGSAELTTVFAVEALALRER